MRSLLLVPVAALATIAPAHAARQVGTKAPDFVARGAEAGKQIRFHLADALKKGPVVLYFFPAAFTPGCNAEAAAFAQAIDDYRKAGATVIGMTAGNTDQLVDFSAKQCSGQFPVAAASPAVVKAYDVSLKGKNAKATGYTDRTSFVIDRKGRIVYSYSDLNPADHVRNTLAAVRKLDG